MADSRQLPCSKPEPEKRGKRNDLSTLAIATAREVFDLLRDLVFPDLKVLGLQAADVSIKLVGDRCVDEYQVNVDFKCLAWFLFGRIFLGSLTPNRASHDRNGERHEQKRCH